MVVIRLTRVGKKNSPAYRVVVADQRRAVKRKFIEIIGNYNPIMKPKVVVISKERALFWLKLGAQPSNTVRNLMADLGIIDKKEKVNIKYSRDKKKKEIKTDKEAKTSTPPADESKVEDIEDTKTEENPEEASESSGEEVKEEVKEEARNEEKNKEDKKDS